ncbi:MAG: T9SS type A sorting domain-containing protein [Candidatus Cloacimonadota bacterium]|nr:T9SS type A sorting domain-containing protein [Candidatus Cloacimonadota bacterium]
MKNKTLIILIIILSFNLNLFSIEFNYNRICDFHIGGWYLPWTISEKCSVLDSNYMYYPNRYGVDVINIDNSTGNLTRAVLKGLPGLTNDVIRKNNYIYTLSFNQSCLNHYRYYIFKIDISTPTNPVVVDSLLFENTYVIEALHYYNHTLLYQQSNPDSNIEKLIFFNEDLEEINSVQILSITYPINDTLFATGDGQSADGFNIYNISDINNIFLQTHIDLSNSPSPIHEGNIQQIDSNTIVRCSNGGLVFWDISDIENWQFISDCATDSGVDRIAKKDNYIYAPQSCDYIESIDISDINNPTHHSCYYFTEEQKYFSEIWFINPTLKINNDFAYMGTMQGGIYKFGIDNGNLNYSNSYLENSNPRGYMSADSLLIDNYFFVPTSYDGIQIYDISNPYEPELILTIVDSCKIFSVQKLNSLLCVCFVNRQMEIKLGIFDISEPNNPIFLSEQNIESVCSLLKNNNEPNSIYLHHYWLTDKIIKYDLSDPQNPEIAFEYELPYRISVTGLFHEGYFYALESSSSYQDLYIFSGFEENEPTLEQTLYNFSPYESDCTVINKIGNYFHIDPELRNGIAEEKFYEFVNPFELVEKFSIEDRWGRFGIIFNNILFKRDYFGTRLFDLSNNPSGYIEPFKNIYSFSGYPKLSFFNQNNSNYFISCQLEGVSIYSYTIENSINEEGFNSNTSTKQFPNPFTTSTTISFTTKTPIAENQQIEIFNIKGQKVKTLEATENGITEYGIRKYSATWDGKNEQGKRVAQGVYFYKVETGEKTVVKKMLLIR